jgi:inorganic pyrophosphatase
LKKPNPTNYEKNYLLHTIDCLAGCTPNTGKQMRNFNAIPSFSSEYVNAVIEIPAGTNKKYEYNLEKKMFLAEYIDGKERLVDFLPYPGNYGFVPSTYLDPKLGGDGDAIDILVISESVPTGTMIEVIPIWIIYFEDSSSSLNLRKRIRK